VIGSRKESRSRKRRNSMEKIQKIKKRDLDIPDTPFFLIFENNKLN